MLVVFLQWSYFKYKRAFKCLFTFSIQKAALYQELTHPTKYCTEKVQHSNFLIWIWLLCAFIVIIEFMSIDYRESLMLSLNTQQILKGLGVGTAHSVGLRPASPSEQEIVDTVSAETTVFLYSPVSQIYYKNKACVTG